MKWRTGILPSILKTQDLNMPAETDTEEFFPGQGKTGYCWLSSALFCLYKMMGISPSLSRLFSMEYLIFYDKREKAERFLNQVLEYSREPLGSQNNKYLLDHPMTDKGQWAMAVNLIRKYGLAFREERGDAEVLTGTGELNACLSYLLRCYAVKIREVFDEHKSDQELFAIKEDAMHCVDDLLRNCYGTQPDRVSLANAGFRMPQAYLKGSIGDYMVGYVSIFCNERMKPGQYCIDLDGNVTDGEPNSFLNLPEQEFRRAIHMQIEREGFCWFTADAGKFFIKNWRLFDDSVFDLAEICGDDSIWTLSRSRIWDYHMGSMAHAMVFLSEPSAGRKYYRVYNSAVSDECGGICYMSESWFRKYVFQAVVHKNYISGQYRDCRNRNFVMKPWDFFPAGS